jgi:hypothetical protein
MSGGSPGVRMSVRQVIVSDLRFERTEASSSSAFWMRSSVNVLSSATRTGIAKVSAAISTPTWLMSVSRRRGSSLKRNAASGAR